MSRNSSNYPFVVSENEPKIDACGNGATMAAARFCRKITNDDAIEAKCAQDDMLFDMWTHFEDNYTTLVSGFDYLNNGQMARFAEKYLSEVKKLTDDTRYDALNEFLFALENSKHTQLYADAIFAEEICKICLEISIPFLERNIQKWTRSLYIGIIATMDSPYDIMLFSKEFRKKRQKNTFFFSVIQHYLCDTDEDWENLKETMFR